MINTEEENNNGTKYCDELNGAKQEEEEEEEVEEVEEPFFVTMMKMKMTMNDDGKLFLNLSN